MNTFFDTYADGSSVEPVIAVAAETGEEAVIVQTAVGTRGRKSVASRSSASKHSVRLPPHASAPDEEQLSQPKLNTPPREVRPYEPMLQAATEADEDEGELTVDIYDGGDAIIVQSTVAGVRPEHLDVAVTNDMITIRGRRTRPENISDEHYYYKELFWGTFSRSVILPEEIEESEVEAVLNQGMLTLKLPKKRRGVVQKVKVKEL